MLLSTIAIWGLSSRYYNITVQCQNPISLQFTSTVFHTYLHTTLVFFHSFCCSEPSWARGTIEWISKLIMAEYSRCTALRTAMGTARRASTAFSSRLVQWIPMVVRHPWRRRIRFSTITGRGVATPHKARRVGPTNVTRQGWSQRESYNMILTNREIITFIDRTIVIFLTAGIVVYSYSGKREGGRTRSENMLIERAVAAVVSKSRALGRFCVFF